MPDFRSLHLMDAASPSQRMTVLKPACRTQNICLVTSIRRSVPTWHFNSNHYAITPGLSANRKLASYPIKEESNFRIARHPPATAKIWTPDFPGALAERLGEWLLKNSFSAQTASKSGDRKCLPGPRKSLVGHPGAMNFPRVFEGEFFNTHAIYHSPRFRRTTS
jgi:hypothetical protein